MELLKINSAMHPLMYTDQNQNPNICSSLVLQIKFTKQACNISKYHGQRKINVSI